VYGREVYPGGICPVHHGGYTSLPTMVHTMLPWVHSVHTRRSSVRTRCSCTDGCDGEGCLGSNLRLITKKEPLRALRSLFLLMFLELSAQSYSALPVDKVRTIG